MRHDFRYEILKQVDHRPWATPDRPWVMTQTWHDLLFAHWPVEAARLRPAIPPAFSLEAFDGQAWLGIVPFQMTNVAPRLVPALPGLSAFPELNVRTYVRVGDKPGVYFFSLDAANPLAVRAARLLFNLPYFSATMRIEAKLRPQAADLGPVIEYESRRRTRDHPADLVATYAPTSSAMAPRPGTLEYFLTERYCLYAVNHRAQPYRLDIHHPPWPLQPADASLARNTMAEACGIRLPSTPPLLHFARRQDMVAWGPERL